MSLSAASTRALRLRALGIAVGVAGSCAGTAHPRAASAQEGSPPAASGAAAEADRERCNDAFDRAQRMRDELRLLAAREALSTCADPRCPTPLRKKCLAWLPGLTDDIPTVVVWATDERGRDATDARVSIDGAPAPGALAGAAIELDPGPHTVRLERDGAPPVEQRIVLAQGHKNRRVEVHFSATAGASSAPPQAAAPPRPTSPRRTAAFVSFAVAGVGLVAGVAAGALAFSRSADLGERCPRPGGCTTGEIDTATALAHASTVAFALAGAGAATGVALLVLWPDDPKTSGAGLGFGAVF